MADTVATLGGGAVLIAGMWLAFQYLGKFHWSHPGWERRGLLLLLLLTLVGGLEGALFWWLDLERSFAWDLPPLASRMLAMAGLAFAAAAFLALQNPTRRRIRLVLIMLVIYLTPLAVVAVLFDLDYFDFSKPLTYAFFGIVLLMSVAANYYLYRQPELVPDTERVYPPPLTRIWLIVVAVITGVWGAALFISDNGKFDWIWVWPGDELTSRLIGVMLLTLTAAALYGFAKLDVARMTLVVLTVYGIGLAVANLWNKLADKPVKVPYVVVFGVIGIVSLILLLLDREVSMTPEPAVAA